MNKVIYEIRTRRGQSVYIYDNLARAKEAAKDAEKRVGVQMVIFKITRIEEELTDA